jgi:hypothetical protein
MTKKVALLTALFISIYLVACTPVATPGSQPTMEIAIPTVVNETAPTAQKTVVLNTPIVAGGAGASQPAGVAGHTLEELKAMTNDEVRVFLNEKLMGHHTIEWLLMKNLTASEWKQFLGEPVHFDLDVTDIERDFLIDWIIKNHQK